VSHECAFLEDIVAHPDEDAPRLVFADWLEDHGDTPTIPHARERAELIRAQCSLARLPEGDGARQAIHAREEELLREFGLAWAEPLRGVVDEWAFRRGFIECVGVHSTQGGFAAGLDELFAGFPIRAVRLACRGEEVLRLLENPDRLARLTSLDVKELARVPALRFMDSLLRPEAVGLRSLLLESAHSSPEWDETLLRLAEPGPLGGLTELGLGFGTVHTPPGRDVLTALASSPHLAGLRKLHLPFTAFSLPVATRLASSHTLARLTHLDLGCAEVSEAGWRRLAAGRNIARLSWLGLFGANVVDASEHLDLEDHELGRRFRELLGDGADFDTSDTFPRWRGARWEGTPANGETTCS
jgi:uncharacterized protein (TIGR02996 family)